MIFGVDVASAGVSKPVSWARAKAEGPISFALMRSNWGTVPDTVFLREWDRLRDAGLVAGAHMFLRFRTVRHGAAPTPAEQTETMIKTLASRIAKGRDLPPCIDVEFPGKGAVEMEMTPEELLDGIRVSWNILRDEYGAPPMIYTSGRVWKEDLDDIAAPELLESPLWLARYPFNEGEPAVRDPVRVSRVDPPVPAPWGDEETWFIHQYQGDAIEMPGFSPTEKVDMNRFHAVAKGDSGGNIRWIQRRLGMATQTGTLDDVTETAIRQFQSGRGLVVDGVVGPRTFTALCWE